MAIRQSLALFVMLVSAALLVGIAPEANTARLGDPYTLDTCPVSGDHLGAMGDPVVKVYHGREVRFCCDGCVVEFEKDIAGTFSRIDEKIIAQQTPFYPLTHCVVNPDDELAVDGAEDVSVSYVWNNRLVRFCCPDCQESFDADPAKYIATIDAAAIDAQSKQYPLTTCVVSGEKLGGMGKTIDKVYANRLVRFCCKACVKKFEKDPAKYFAQIDAARRQTIRSSGWR